MVFRYSEDKPGLADAETAGLGPTGLGPTGLGPTGLGPTGLGPTGLGPTGLGPVEDEETGIDLTEGLRERLLLTEPVLLVTAAHGPAHSGVHGGAQSGAEPPVELAGYARHRWIAGCDRCRANLLRQCALAGFTPKIAFTTDDYIAVQALVAAGLGVSTLPALCLRAARHPGIRTVPLPGTHRDILAVRYGDPPDPPAVTVLMEALRAVAVPPPRSADGRAGHSADNSADDRAGETAQAKPSA
jgi:hypothetical protein